ncbi:MAG: hypothetical protein M3441_07580 [Chloroflexota bacterium]|nr:hypothetical protein [Chloroflexota bacterium]
MLKLNVSQLALTAILVFAFVLGVGVLSTQASNNGQRAEGALNLPNAVQTAPPPVGTYPPPVPSYPPPIPSRYPLNTPTAKPTREPEPTATPHPWLRYVELLPGEQR